MSKKVKNLLDEGLESEQLESLKKKEERLARLNKESTIIPINSQTMEGTKKLSNNLRVVLIGKKTRFKKPKAFLEKQKNLLQGARLNRKPISSIRK